MEQGLRQPKPLQHAFRIFLDAHIAPVLQADQVQKFRNALLSLASLHPRKGSIKIQHPVTGQISGEPMILRQITDRPPRLRLARILTEQLGRSVGGMYRGEEHFYERRLPRPIRAQQAVLHARRHTQAEIRNRPDLASAPSRSVNLFETVSLNGEIAHHPVPLRIRVNREAGSATGTASPANSSFMTFTIRLQVIALVAILVTVQRVI